MLQIDYLIGKSFTQTLIGLDNVAALSLILIQMSPLHLGIFSVAIRYSAFESTTGFIEPELKILHDPVGTDLFQTSRN